MGTGSRTFVVGLLTAVFVVGQLPAMLPHVARSAPPIAAATIDPIDPTGATFVQDTHTLVIGPGGSAGLTYQFRNDGTTAWVKGGSDQDVALSVCVQIARTRSNFGIDCGVISPNAAWANPWLSTSIYADQTEDTVAPGAIGSFGFGLRVPDGTPPGEYIFLARLYRPEINRPFGPVLKQMVRVPHGNLYTVNDTGDAAICNVEFCTLRGALTRANDAANSPGVDTIAFNVFGPPIIAPASALPTISEAGVVIDGTTQLGYIDHPLIELRGTSAGPVNGLNIQKASVIRGLSIGGFARWAIEATAGGGGLIAGNYIGVSPSGESLVRNGTDGDAGTGGIHVLTPSYAIGTLLLGDGNIVSGNFGQGIFVGNNDAPGTSVTSNLVGVTRSGLAAGNQINGVLVASPDVEVQDNVIASNGGGIATSEDRGEYLDNVIRNNTGAGILMSGSDNLFDRNEVRANGASGIFMGFPGATTRNNAFTDNVVIDNLGNGFVMRGPVGDPTEITDTNTITGGSISNNSQLGISLAFGANGGVLPPVITDVTMGGGATLTVSGTAALNADVQVYADPIDEGLYFLGSVRASDGDGTWTISSWVYPDMTAIANAVKAGALKLHVTQTTATGTSEFSSASAGIVGIATCNGDTRLPGATVELYSGSVLLATTIASTPAALYVFAGTAPNSAYTIRIKKFFPPIEGPVGGFTISCGATSTTDGQGNGTVTTGTTVPNRKNHTWNTAYQITSGVPIDDYVVRTGQSTWFKITIRPGQRLSVDMTNVPTNLSLALYKDIRKLYDAQISALNEDPLRAIAELDAAVAPDALSPDELSPDELSPDELSPDALSPDELSPDELSPDELSPDELSPDELSPDALSPDELSPDELSPDELSPDELSAEAYAAAQTAALIGVSAHVGLSPEHIARNTWENTGDFYIRVRGHNGAFDPARPFTLKATITDVSCAGASLATFHFTPGTLATDRQTLVLTNTARFGTADTTTLMSRLATFAGRTEVKGAIVDLAGVTSAASAYAQWDANALCPSAANSVAELIKEIVNAYFRANAGLKYVVLVGNDSVVPFYRTPDQSGLGSEKDYFPAVRDPTPSQASLRLGYVLTQDFYGSMRPISRFDHTLYLPDLAVGRLVETPAQAVAVLDAYLSTTGGRVAPTRAFVSGYDFLSDAATFMADNFAANGLATTRLIQPTGDGPTAPTAWTGDQLKAALLGATTYGILSLNAHFSANTALAADFATRMRTSDLAALPPTDTRFRNTLVLSTGCHSGYSLVDPHATTLTNELDWTQAFAARGATMIGGTGYQYGDTDFMKYTEALLANTTLELRYGSGPIAIGTALTNAKRTYISSLPAVGGIDEKALAEATLFGLPMLGYDLPAGSRLARPALPPSPILNGLTSDGLSFATFTPTYALTLNSRSLNVTGGGTQSAIFYDIDRNVAVRPTAPVLPLLTRTVGVAGQNVRGAVLFSATYEDQPNITPFTDVATTEVRGVHPRYVTDVFTPVRPFDLNQFGAATFTSTPYQFRSDPGETNGTARRYTAESFRIYYSSLTDDRALASSPVVYQVTLTPNGANVDVTAIVGALADVGVEEVFATYTGETGALYGQWRSLRLTAGATTSNGAGLARTYTGSIPMGSTPAGDVRVLLQAVGGNALVTWASNDGAYYRVVEETATVAEPKITTSLSLSSAASATYRSTIQVRARLLAAGAPLAAHRVSFRLAGMRVDAVTGSDGWATAPLPVRAAPGNALVTVGFIEDEDYLGSGAESPILIERAPTAIAPSASGPAPVSGSVIAGVLRSGTETLGGQLVTLSGGGRTAQTFTDGFGRIRMDATDGFPSGAFRLTMTYAGNDRYLPSTTEADVVVFDPNGFAAGVGTITAGSDAIGFMPGKRVTFAFAAIYRRGATTPIGILEVLSVDSRILFSATSFSWLTVNGKRAEMLGQGVVNGRSGWSFRVVAVDGSPDRIEIRIWQNGVTTYESPTYRVTGTVARGIIVRLLNPSERDFSPLQLRGLAERE